MLIFHTYLIKTIIFTKQTDKFYSNENANNLFKNSIIVKRGLSDGKNIKKSYLEHLFVVKKKNNTKVIKNDSLKVLFDFPDYSKPLKLINDSVVYNSQILQDFIILQLLNTNESKNLAFNGFFIEAGAYDGQTMSNTLYFERFHNWTGLLIEPSKTNYDKLLGVNRKAHSINCCLTSSSESHKSYLIEAGPFSVITTQNKNNNIIVCHSLDRILKKLTKILNKKLHISYLSLDLEGQEKSIVETFPWKKYDIKLISIEYNQNKSLYDWILAYLSDFGFKETIRDDVYFQDVYLAHESIYDLLNFSYSKVSEIYKIFQINKLQQVI